MVTAIANARMTVPAPVRTARRFGLLSVAGLTDGGGSHWMLGGLTADAELCSKPSVGTINCTPSAAKSGQSWYDDIEGEPWLTYMFETCRTVGRYAEAAEKVRARFEAAEQSAVELGFQQNVLNGSTSIGAAAATVAAAIGQLEAAGAADYGGQLTLHLPFVVAEEAARAGLLQRYGDHLETLTGSLVSVGNYLADANGGSAAVPVLYATGTVNLYRSALAEAGPSFTNINEYFALVERAYGALVDCFNRRVTATLCGCGGA